MENMINREQGSSNPAKDIVEKVNQKYEQEQINSKLIRFHLLSPFTDEVSLHVKPFTARGFTKIYDVMADNLGNFSMPTEEEKNLI